MKNNTVTLQKTHKKWKLVNVISLLLIGFGIILFIFIAGLYNDLLTLLSVTILVLGILGLITAKIGAYWSNG